MPVSSTNDALPIEYTPTAPPQSSDPAVVANWMYRELQEVATAINRLAILAPQVADREPTNPVRGMIRYEISADWDPVGGGTDKYIVYDGTNWGNL